MVSGHIVTAGAQKFLARRIRDVTSVTAEDLLSPVAPLKLVGEVIQSETPRAAKCRVVCVASGKGGTGKTVVTSNLAALLAKEGLKVLLFDADLGLANAHLVLGVTPLDDISKVVSGERKLSDIMVECACGLKLVSGGSGFSDLADLKDGGIRNLAFELKELEDELDIIMVDLSAGISPQVVRFLSAAHDVVIVTNPDASALLDAYAVIKVMTKTCGNVNAKIIVNKAREREDAVHAFKKIEDVAARRLTGAELLFFGWLPQNFYIQDSVSRREPVVLCHPKSFVTANLKTMAARIFAEQEDWIRKMNDGDDGSARPVSFAWKLSHMIF